MSLLSKIHEKSNQILKKIAGNPVNVPFRNINSSSDILNHKNITRPPSDLANDQQVSHHFGIDNEEGQLALDVYHTADDLIINAPIAGVTLKDVSITISDGILTIRGSRQHEDNIPSHDYYLQECFWGNFSRSIVLPNNLKTEQIKALFKNGY
jgi:HSP20 family protein